MSHPPPKNWQVKYLGLKWDQSGWVDEQGAHHKLIKNTSTCRTILRETNERLAEDLLYNKNCKKDLHITRLEWENEVSGQNPLPWRDLEEREGSCLGDRAINSLCASQSWGPARRVQAPLPLENLLRQTWCGNLDSTGEECWLANSPSRESLAMAAATLLHFPVWRGECPSSTQLHTTAWCKNKAMIQSTYAETDQGSWGVIWAELRWPLSTHPPASATGTHSGHVLSLGREALCRKIQWLVFQQEYMRSAHSTPQWRTRSGVDSSQKKSTKEAAQILGSSIVTSFPTVTVPQPQPHNHPNTKTR